MQNKPNQTQFPKSQNEIKLLFNKGLWKCTPSQTRAKQSQYKPNQSQFPRPTRPNIPNQTQFQTRCTLAVGLYFTSLSSRFSSAPCNLCSSKRWPTYSAAFVWSLVVFFAFFVETAALNFFLLDFAISLQSPCWQHSYPRLKCALESCFLRNINTSAKECNLKFAIT